MLSDLPVGYGYVCGARHRLWTVKVKRFVGRRQSCTSRDLVGTFRVESSCLALILNFALGESIRFVGMQRKKKNVELNYLQYFVHVSCDITSLLFRYGCLALHPNVGTVLDCGSGVSWASLA